MDIAVHPSLTEALGQAVLEAMGVGTPVVATSVGGILDIVTTDVDGILVRPGDSQSLADGIIRLSQDAALRECMGRRGRETIRRRFSADTMVERYLALYDELAATR